MTTHPEDAMTRERALEEALRKIERLIEQCETDYESNATKDDPDTDSIGWDKRGPLPMTFGHIRDARKALRALASAQQEPAPAADAEEIADLTERCKEIIDWKDTGTLKGEALRKFAKRQQEIDILEYHALPVAESKTAREAMEFVIAAAIRRYAGDGGVTDEMVEAANREYWKNRQGPKMSEDRKQFERDKMRAALEAAARAKSGEKGGTR